MSVNMAETEKNNGDRGAEVKKFKNSYGEEFILPNFTMKEIYDAIPSHCFERSYVRSFSYVFRDLAMAVSLGYAATFIHLLPSLPLRVLAWALYTVVQGMVCTGIWVLGHECGHQAFSPSKTVNDATGWVLHSALLVPYFSWKHSHSKHHKNTGHIERDVVFKPRTLKVKREGLGLTEEDTHERFMDLVDETPLATLWVLIRQQIGGWQAYILANLSGQKYEGVPKYRVNHFHPDSPLYEPSQRNEIILSDIGVGTTLSILAISCHYFGTLNVLLYYVIPYIWVHHWLVFITYLQHTDPLLPHYRGNQWSFQRGASATIDREFGFIGRVLMHKIIETHVLHHLISRIPFYHAEEATSCIKKVMGEHYMKDDTPMFTALWRSARMCQWVDDEGDVVFFKNGHGLGDRMKAQ